MDFDLVDTHKVAFTAAHGGILNIVRDTSRDPVMPQGMRFFSHAYVTCFRTPLQSSGNGTMPVENFQAGLPGVEPIRVRAGDRVELAFENQGTAPAHISVNIVATGLR